MQSFPPHPWHCLQQIAVPCQLPGLELVRQIAFATNKLILTTPNPRTQRQPVSFNGKTKLLSLMSCTTGRRSFERFQRSALPRSNHQLHLIATESSTKVKITLFSNLILQEEVIDFMFLRTEMMAQRKRTMTRKLLHGTRSSNLNSG